jgi:hypothetical protein
VQPRSTQPFTPALLLCVALLASTASGAADASLAAWVAMPGGGPVRLLVDLSQDDGHTPQGNSSSRRSSSWLRSLSSAVRQVQVFHGLGPIVWLDRDAPWSASASPSQSLCRARATTESDIPSQLQALLATHLNLPPPACA